MNDPSGFVRDVLNAEPAPYQAQAMLDLIEKKRVCIRAPHGLGKSCCAAWLVLWFMARHQGDDCKVITTASAWRQLTLYLWPEIHLWARRANWGRIGLEVRNGKELLTLQATVGGASAFAVASNDHTKIEGAHASHLLYIFDESKAIPPETWDAAEGAFSSGDAYALAISTPEAPVGRFYQIQSRKPGYEDWHAVKWSLEDGIKAGRVSQDWAEKRKAQWGEQNPVYQNRVLGEFAAAEDGLVPLSWIEAANDRWQEIADKDEWGDFTCVGCDIARSGEDKTLLALRYGEAIKELRKTSKEDTMMTAGRITGILNSLGGRAIVDVVGLGAGVVDRLRETGKDIEAFNGAERTEMKDKSQELGFINKRTASWWNLRELLDPTGTFKMALPPDDELTGDLCGITWRVSSGGRIQLESKDELKKRLGRSPDCGDAVAYAFWNMMGGMPIGGAAEYKLNQGRERGVLR